MEHVLTSGAAKGLLRDIMSLLRLTSKFPKLMPAIQVLIVMIYIYDICSNAQVKNIYSKVKGNFKRENNSDKFTGVEQSCT